MPDYRDPLHGVSYSEAYAEAMAVAPIGRAMLYALELRHSELAAPIRLVLNDADIDATLEDDAPEDASTEVTFTAMQFGIQLPPESDDAASPGVQLWIDGVSALVAGEIEPAAKTLEPIQMLLRVYASDDLSGPAVLPVLAMELRGVEVDESRVTATAAYGDFANARFPGKTFTRGEYPGLGVR